MLQVREWIEFAAQGIEALAVAVMVFFIIIGTTRWIFHSLKKIEGGYRALPGRVRENIAGRIGTHGSSGHHPDSSSRFDA